MAIPRNVRRRVRAIQKNDLPNHDGLGDTGVLQDTHYVPNQVGERA